MWRKAIGAWGIGLGLASFAAGAVEVTMTDLGTFGGAFSVAEDINRAGTVVGWSARADGVVRAFAWTRATGMRDLGTLAGGLRSQALSINEAGFIAGLSDQRAVVWRPDGSIVALGTLGGSFSSIVRINEAGQVAGISATPSGAFHAFLWSEATGMRDLGTLGGDSSRASAINEAGHVAGCSRAADGTEHVFLWTPEDGMIDVGTLGGTSCRPEVLNDADEVAGRFNFPDFTSRAFHWSRAGGLIELMVPGDRGAAVNAMNRSGQVAGVRLPASDSIRAFLWSKSAGMQDLGTLGGRSSSAIAMNDSGQVAGVWNPTAGGERTFLWTAQAGMRDLGTLGTASTFPTLIDASGLVVGELRRADGTRAFGWTPDDGMFELGSLGGSRTTASSRNATNDNGQVIGRSLTPAGHEHAVLWEIRTRDTAAPILELLGDNPAAAECGAGYSDPGATARDDVDGDLTSRIVVTGSVDPAAPGTYTLRYNVADAAGNAAAEVTRTVIVADTTAPVVRDTSVSPDRLWPPSHRMVDVSLDYAAADGCAAVVSCALDVASDEPASAHPGDAAPDWQVLSDHYLQLRAERAPLGDGRTYRVGVRCTDASGNAGAAEARVVVPHSPNDAPSDDAPAAP